MTGNYTDCPQREKNGWTGDASVTKRASAIILNDYTSAEVFMRSMYLNIYEDGRPSVIVPHLSGDNSLYEEFDIPWASAYFTFPYYTYMQTGDKYYIEESYYSLLKVFDYFKSTDKNKDFLIEYNRYGDWLGYDNHDGKVNRQVISTMYFYHCGKLLSQMAEIIGREHNELDIYLEKVRSALNKIELKTQTEKAIALDFNIVPDADRENTKKSLLKLIRDADTTLRTGVLGTMSLYNSLSVENGHKTLIDLTLTDKKCSFGYMLDHGATTLWEYWDVAGSTFNSNLTEGKPAIWDSQNHCMLGGGLTNWLFGGIGGIEPISAAYRSIKLRPGVESGLKKVECSLDTVIGKVISDWRFVNNKFVYSVVVPVNAEASLILPFENAKSITESGRNIFMKSGDGIKYERKQKEGYVYTLGSGTYYFEVSNTKANNYKYVIASILCDIVVSALIVICYLINKHRKEKK